MKGVNKKARLIIITLILIECFSIFLTYKSFENKKINEDIKKYEFNKNTFAIYVEKDDNYEEVKDGFWPDTTYAYRYNEEKSYCVNNNNEKLLNVLFFDNSQKEAKVVTKQTVYCYLYFDERLDIKINIPDNDISKKIGFNKTINCNGSANATWFNKNNSILINYINSKEAECTVGYNGSLTGTKLTEQVKDDVNTLINQFKSNYSNIYDEEFNYNRDTYGYRYFNPDRFKEPNNFIWFNNELWRIIGSIPTTKADGTKTNLVKIIRNSSIGNYQYHNSQNLGSVSWGNNYLYNMLNGAYYKSENGNKENNIEYNTCRYYKDETSWSYKSSCDFENTGLNENSMIEKVLWNVGSTTPSNNAISSFLSERDESKQGFVGLLSPSDYGLAFWPSNVILIGSASLKRICEPSFNLLGVLDGLNSIEGTKKVWLYSQMTEPTINRTSNGLNTLNIRGCIKEYNSSTTNDIVDIPTAVRPVVYLKENVFTYDGDGTINNPYQITMN